MTGNLANISGGLQMSLIAFSIVFIVIAFLMFMMLLLHKLCYKFGRQKEATENKLTATLPETKDEGELVAVLTAAVMQYTSANARVISFRPSAACAPKKSAWRSFGRVQNFERHVKR